MTRIGPSVSSPAVLRGEVVGGRVMEVKGLPGYC